MLWPGGGRGGDLYHMGNGLLIFARADDGANQLFHGALLSTVNYLLIVISAEERSAMEQLSTSGSGGTVTAIIDTPRDGAPARRRCAPAPSGAHDSLSHLHLLLIQRRRGQVRGDQDGGGRVLALPCAPEGRPDAAAAAAMLAGLLPWRGLARLGLHVRDGDELLHALLVAVATQHTLSFSVSRNLVQVQLGEGGVLAALALAAEGRVGECGGVVRTLANDMIVVIYRQGREASGDVAGQSSSWWG